MALKAAATIMLGFAVAPSTAATISKRVTGGSDAGPGDFPFIVSLSEPEGGSGHFCGGSLLNPTTVVTAAHCVGQLSPGSMLVSAGSVTQGQFKANARVESAKTHPQYKKRGFESDDIAILKLATPIEKSETIGYVALPAVGSDPAVNDTGLAGGWGVQEPIPSLNGVLASKTLRKVSLSVHQRNVCANLDSDASGFDTLICAGGQGKSTCKFDSGGPLVDEETGQLIGISSWVIKDQEGNFCDNAPSLFTRVSSYISFITENMNVTATPPTPAESSAGGKPSVSAPTAQPTAGGKLPFKEAGPSSADCGFRGFDDEICGTQRFCEGFDENPRPFTMAPEDEKRFANSKECFEAHEPASNSAASTSQPSAGEKLPFRKPGQFSADCGFRGFDEETCGTQRFCEGFDENPRPFTMDPEDEKKHKNSEECFAAHQLDPELQTAT